MQWTCFCCRRVADGDGASQDGMDGWTDGERGGDRHIDTETRRERRTFRADWPRAEYFSMASCTAP
jgi:hypothetical protein